MVEVRKSSTRPDFPASSLIAISIEGKEGRLYSRLWHYGSWLSQQGRERSDWTVNTARISGDLLLMSSVRESVEGNLPRGSIKCRGFLLKHGDQTSRLGDERIDHILQGS